MEKFIFDYWNKNFNGNYDGIYLGNEACPEFIKKNLDLINENSNLNYYKVLVLPPLFGEYFKILKKINLENFDEITVNDFGAFEYLYNEGFKLNLGRQIIKFKTGAFNLDEISKEDLENIREMLVSDFILNHLKDKINLIELNPVIQGINLKEGFNYSLYYPYILNASTLMCWSNIKNIVQRVEDCDTICKKFEGEFIKNKYLLMGNQTLNKNNEKIESYLKKIKNRNLIKRIVYLKY